MTADRKSVILSFVIMTSAVFGAVVSSLLVFEYYGITPSAAEAVCSKGGGVNACTVVSSSRFAAIKGIPLIKEFPVAAGGVFFYGFILLFQLFNFFRVSSESIKSIMKVIILLSSVAFTGDIILYIISIFIIKFVCPLCFMTYIATLMILISSIMMYRKITMNDTGDSSMKTGIFFKSKVVLFIASILISGAAAAGVTEFARLMAEKKENVTFEERLDRAIREYESADALKIVTDDVPRIGSKNAPAQFAVFFDYTCNHCMNEINFLETLLKKYPDALAVNFKFVPLAGDCGTLPGKRDDESAEGCVAAAAAFSAHLQGRYMDFSKLLFESYHKKNNSLSQSKVRELAGKSKLNITAFEKEFISDSTIKFIKREYDESERLGINSTPTVYLNGKLLSKSLRRYDIMEGLVQYCVKRGR